MSKARAGLSPLTELSSPPREQSVPMSRLAGLLKAPSLRRGNHSTSRSGAGSELPSLLPQAAIDATLRWALPKATEGLAHSDKAFPKLYPLETKADPSSPPSLAPISSAGCLGRGLPCLSQTLGSRAL